MTASPALAQLLASDLVDDPSRSAAQEPVRARATAERRRRWGRHATLGAVALGSIGGFFAISRTITQSSGNTFDRAVVRVAGRARNPVNTAIARAITSLGGVVGATGVAVSAVIATRRRPRSAMQVAVGSLGGLAAELGIKRFFKRKRPSVLAHLEEVGSTSFPSGHSMAASSLYLTLAFVASRSRRLRAHRAGALAAAGALATAIGATRVYLGVHWPTDVLAGLALGTTWACAAEAAFDFTGADRVEREAKTVARAR